MIKAMPNTAALTEPNPLRDAMMEAARHAAAIAITRGREGLKVEIKPDGSKVTNGDADAQTEILTRLKAYGDTHQNGVPLRFLAEEKLDDKMKQQIPGIETLSDTPQEWDAKDKKGFYWVIDPIDGTGNYSQIYSGNNEGQQLPWAVSIALQHDGRTVAAAVYEAMPGEREAAIDANGHVTGLQGKLYWAERGLDSMTHSKGAYEIDCPTGNTRRLGCAPINEPMQGATAYLEHFVPDSDAVHLQPTHKVPGALFKSQQNAYDHFGLVTDDAKSACAAAIEVAAGRSIDGGKQVGAFSHGFACPWDWAATSLILEEAGVPVVVADAGTSSVNPNTPPLSILIAARNQPLMRALVDNYNQTLAEHYPQTPAGPASVAKNLGGWVADRQEPRVASCPDRW